LKNTNSDDLVSIILDI